MVVMMDDDDDNDALKGLSYNERATSYLSTLLPLFVPCVFYRFLAFYFTPSLIRTSLAGHHPYIYHFVVTYRLPISIHAPVVTIVKLSSQRTVT